eukprot:gene27767-7407_t
MPTQAEILDDAKKRVKEAVLLFEHKEGSKLVDSKDIGTLVRSLGLNPTGSQIEILRDQLTALTSETLMASEHIEAVVSPFLVQQETLLRDDYHTLLRSFRAFDPEGKGYIEQEQFKGMLSSRGEPMTEEELNRMFAFSADDNGRIFYEDYAQKLCVDGRRI